MLRKGALRFCLSRWSHYREVVFKKTDYETTFMRSSGPGGQSVNTTNSKAEIRLKLLECSVMDDNTLNNLRLKYSNAITKGNELVVRSQVHKSQGQNLDDCFEKLQKMIFECSQVKEERSEEPFEEPEENREKRLSSKKKKSQVKSTRQGRYCDY